MERGGGGAKVGVQHAVHWIPLAQVFTLYLCYFLQNTDINLSLWIGSSDLDVSDVTGSVSGSVYNEFNLKFEV